MFCKSTCSASDPAKDSVKIDPSAIETRRLEAEREEAERSAREQAEEERRSQEEAERTRFEAETRRQEEEERARREEEEEAERVRREEARREQALREQEEEARREQEELKAQLQQEEAQRKEAELRQLEEDERKNQDALGQFYARHGFTGVNEPRRSGCAVLRAATTYPLHCAAELGDEGIVCMLLKEGAATWQKDSSGRTAAQLAQRKNKGGSHDGVLRALGVSAGRPRAGGA